MTWLRVDDNTLDDPQWVLALQKGGSAAAHLWLACSLYAARHHTDGVIPVHMLDSVPGPRGRKVRAKAYQALLDAALLTRLPDGSVAVADHLARNPSREEVLRKRSRWALAQRKHRDGEGVIEQAVAEAVDDQAASAPERHPIPSPPVPIPSRPVQTGPSGGRQPGLRPPREAEGAPAVWRTLDGWEEPEGLEEEAVAAGVPREFFRERLQALRNTTIGGKGGVRDRTAFVRQQLPRWRSWAESGRNQSARSQRDWPNQPNCGLTGLEGVMEVGQ